MVNSNGAILTIIFHISKSFPVQIQKSTIFFLQSPLQPITQRQKKT